jgi:hypothetical protein
MVQAQQAGSNVGVLPVVIVPADPAAYLKGDLFLQRQLEPSIAVSTRNPLTLVSFFNDYRAVDVATDTGVGEGTPEKAGWTLLAWTRPLAKFFARLVGARPAGPHVNSLRGGGGLGGMSRSYDGDGRGPAGSCPAPCSDHSAASKPRRSGTTTPPAPPRILPWRGAAGSSMSRSSRSTARDSKLAVAKYGRQQPRGWRQRAVCRR